MEKNVTVRWVGMYVFLKKKKIGFETIKVVNWCGIYRLQWAPVFTRVQEASGNSRNRKHGLWTVRSRGRIHKTSSIIHLRGRFCYLKRFLDSSRQSNVANSYVNTLAKFYPEKTLLNGPGQEG